MTSNEIRQIRDKFRKSKKHVYLPEVSLVSSKESTSLFNLAGMQQLIPYLAGKPHELGKRLHNIQKCVRTVDVDEVGDNRHLTMFGMMGNWSLGDYFKKEAVEWSREFLTDKKYLGLDPKKLAVTVFEGDKNAPRDEETAGYRKNAGVPEDKISYMGADDNWRSPGPVGPCGSDTEIFYRVGEGLPTAKDNVKDSGDKYMEIWNNVFMEYYRDDNGKLTKLKDQNVDTGMGFERICKVLQNKETVFETDLFWPIIEEIEKIIGLKYFGNERRFRIIVDHMRTAIFLIGDGVIPSNEGRGYVLRRLIRRAYFNLRQLIESKLSNQSINEISYKICLICGKNCENIYGDIYKEIIKNSKQIISEIKKEFESFEKTLSRGISVLSEILTKNKILTGNDAFLLYDTYGFPFELTIEITKERLGKVDEKLITQEFEKEMEKQKNKSRQSSKMFNKDIDRSKYLEGINKTEFVGYENIENSDGKLLKDISIDGQRVLIFDKTPFYAESGGQTGDKGTIELNNGEILQITDVKKYEGVFLHFVK